MSVPKPSKVVRRSVALGLGIICIVLIAGLGGELAFYFLMVSDRDSTIARKDNQITLLNSEISQLESNVTKLQSQVNNVTNMVDDLTIILTLGKSTIWVNGETVNIMGRHPTYEENASFAGYVSVQFSSQSNVTVEVSYFSHGVSYENSIIVGSSGTAVFPVLPSSISIYIFQTPFADPYVLSDVYATVTITYYY